MNAIYLHLPNGEPTKWSMCGECGSIAAPGNYDLTQKCCTCYDCGGPLAKDERVPYAEGKGKSLYHPACERTRRAQRTADALNKAELVPGYDGPVYCEGRRGSYGDGYFADMMELVEELDVDEDQSSRPEFVFCCERIPFPGVRVESLIESALDEMDDDAGDRLDGIEDLEKACLTFNERNKDLISWGEDRKRKVAVPALSGKS